MHWRVHLRFSFRKHLKMHKSVMKKMHVTLQLVIHLTVQSRGAPEGTYYGAPKDALRDIHNNVQEGAFQVALKGALEDAL